MLTKGTTYSVYKNVWCMYVGFANVSEQKGVGWVRYRNILSNE